MFEIEIIPTNGKAAQPYATEYVQSRIGIPRFAGCGAFAEVVTDEAQTVAYKIGKVARNTPYLSYLLMLQGETTQNPYAPTIQKVSVFVSDDNAPTEFNSETLPGLMVSDAVFVVEMEVLHPLTNGEYDQLQHSGFFEYDNCGWAPAESRVDSIAGLSLSFGVDTTLADLARIINAAYSLAELFDFSAAPDISRTNVMARANGQIVVTDPIA